jgi:opacity protein-like surface antigen
VFTISSLLPNAVYAEDNVDTLKRELAAQQFLNAQLKKKIEQLELQVEGVPPEQQSRNVDLERVIAPSAQNSDDVENTAIAESLVSKGVALLPNGKYRVSPFFSWNHNGSGADRRDIYGTGVALEAGLPWEMAASVRLPYVYRDYDSSTNKGLGDISVSLSKTLLNETEYLPSVVARLTYIHDTGKDAFDAVPVGSGFKTYDLSMFFAKRFDPIVVFGNLGYQHSKSENAVVRNNQETAVFDGMIKLGDVYSAGAGVSLIATPGISLDAGVSYSFVDRTTFRNDLNGLKDKSNRSTVGIVTIGSNFLINKNLSLQVTAGAGVTDDAVDSLLFVNLPYRF